jgi:L-cysteine desulfidase
MVKINNNLAKAGISAAGTAIVGLGAAIVKGLTRQKTKEECELEKYKARKKAKYKQMKLKQKSKKKSKRK